MVRRTSLLVLATILATASTGAQSSVRRATNLAALLAYPGFFHLKPVLVVGTVGTTDKGDLEVTSGSSVVRVVTSGSAPDGIDEVRGEFWDLGRMKADDSRLAGYDLNKTFRLDPRAPWPRAGELVALMATAVTPASAPLSPSIRAIVLSPTRYLDRRVTVTGQYSGRNLNGELPDAPARSRYDFVLRSGDAALWVTNVPPRGRNFELQLDSRLDTSRWLQVSGTVQQGRGLQWIEGDAGSLTLAEPVRETPEDEGAQVALPPPSAPEVVFSTPTEGETEVSPTTTIRIQFSRELSASTLGGRVRVSYARSDQPNVAPPEFTVTYTANSRVVELKFSKPLQPFRTVRVEFLEGITGRINQPVKPWTLSFSLGG